MTLERRLRLFVRRAGAYGIDIVLLFAVIVATQGLIWAIGLNPVAADPQPWPMHAWVFAGVTLPVLLYFSLMVSRRGATLGQSALKLRVLTDGEGRPPFGRSLLRAAILLLPWELIHTAMFHQWWWALAAAYVGLAVLIGSVVLQAEGRGLHDRAGGVRVVGAAAQ